MRVSSGLTSALAAFLIIGSGTSSLALPTAQALYTETYAEGVWRYECTLYNGAETATGFDIFDFFLKFDSAATINAVTTPVGWALLGWTDEPSSWVEWFATESGISPGAVLGGMAFSSGTQLGSLCFEAMFTNPDGDPLLWTGKTEPMICVPEPSSSILLVFGLVSLVLLSRLVRMCPVRR